MGPWLNASAAVLEGFGRNYGLWVKITVACSNRRWGCQEERAEAWAVYGESNTHMTHVEIHKCSLRWKKWVKSIQIESRIQWASFSLTSLRTYLWWGQVRRGMWLQRSPESQRTLQTHSIIYIFCGNLIQDVTYHLPMIFANEQDIRLADLNSVLGSNSFPKSQILLQHCCLLNQTALSISLAFTEASFPPS